MNLFEQANYWRSRWKISSKEGAVIFFDGVAQGWIDNLDRPDQWVPGCVAVDNCGNVFESVGGNTDEGANAWSPIQAH